MGGNILEVRRPSLVPRNSVSIIDDPKIVLATFPPARNRDMTGPGIDAVFDELGDGL